VSGGLFLLSFTVYYTNFFFLYSDVADREDFASSEWYVFLSLFNHGDDTRLNLSSKEADIQLYIDAYF
jgi:hypothetical protein